MLVFYFHGKPRTMNTARTTPNDRYIDERPRDLHYPSQLRVGRTAVNNLFR